MTTDQPQTQQPAPLDIEPGYRSTSVGTPVRAALLAALVVGLAAVLLAALVSGTSGALGAGIAVAMVCLFFALGAAVLIVATRLAPAVSLLVALLTYTLKVALIGLVFLALASSGAQDGSVDGRWLGGTVIACTLAWMTTQIVFTMRARQLAYDLPSRAEEANTR